MSIKPDLAHSFKVEFATEYIPRICEPSKRMGLLAAISNQQVLEIMQNSWDKAAEAILGKDNSLSSEGLDCTGFQDSDCFFILFTFPEPTLDDEPYYALAVFDPNKSKELKDLEQAPYRYFIGTRQDEHSLIVEQINKKLQVQARNVPVDTDNFVNWVMNATVRNTNISGASSNDVLMNQAIAKAQATLDEITQRFLNGELENFTVKAKVVDGDAAEHFWISNTTYEDGYYSGTIEEEAHSVSTIKEGQSYRAAKKDITDWMYLKDRQMVGNYTLRASLTQLPQEQVNRMKGLLASDPEFDQIVEDSQSGSSDTDSPPKSAFWSFILALIATIFSIPYLGWVSFVMGHYSLIKIMQAKGKRGLIMTGIGLILSYIIVIKFIIYSISVFSD